MPEAEPEYKQIKLEKAKASTEPKPMATKPAADAPDEGPKPTTKEEPPAVEKKPVETNEEQVTKSVVKLKDYNVNQNQRKEMKAYPLDKTPDP